MAGPPRSWVKILTSNMKPSSLLPFCYLLFLSANAQEDNAPYVQQLSLNLPSRSQLHNRSSYNILLAKWFQVIEILYVTYWLNKRKSATQQIPSPVPNQPLVLQQILEINKTCPLAKNRLISGLTALGETETRYTTR